MLAFLIFSRTNDCIMAQTLPKKNIVHHLAFVIWERKINTVEKCNKRQGAFESAVFDDAVIELQPYPQYDICLVVFVGHAVAQYALCPAQKQLLLLYIVKLQMSILFFSLS